MYSDQTNRRIKYAATKRDPEGAIYLMKQSDNQKSNSEENRIYRKQESMMAGWHDIQKIAGIHSLFRKIN